MAKVLVIGGGAAGMSAASKAKRTNPSLDITVVEGSGYVSYAPCGIPYFLGGLIPSDEDLVYYKPEVFIKKRGIDVRIRTRVTSIDLDSRIAIVEDAEGSNEELNYDYLVIATGAEPIKPPIEGIELEGIETVKFIEDGIKIKKMASNAENIVVVGGGYIGLEMVDAFHMLGKKVTLIEMLPHVLPNIDLDMAELLHDELRKNGVDLRLEEKVVAFEGDEKVKKVITEKGEYMADLVILAVGVKPQTALFKNSKLEFGVKGAIKVNEKMQANIEGVYAVGDVAETKHLVTGKPTWIPLAQTANKMGRVAGSNIAGVEMTFPGVLGTAFTKVMNLNIARTGLNTEEAKQNGFNVGSVKIKSRTKAHYYPNSKEIQVKLIYDKDSRKLLGGQLISEGDPSGRANIIATALYAGLKVDDIFYIDLGYAPPFAPVWDPLVIASSVASKD
ncbi:MAG: CoA-disulfide reductase [Candidatus Njordarchaeia archaeon]